MSRQFRVSLFQKCVEVVLCVAVLEVCRGCSACRNSKSMSRLFWKSVSIQREFDLLLSRRLF